MNAYLTGAVSIILAALEAGWSVNWQGNEMVLHYPEDEEGSGDL